MRLRENAAGDTRFLARFSYLLVLFSGYCFLFEIDRYFVGTTVGEIVTSKYRRPRSATGTVMRIRLVERIPYDQPDPRAAVTSELYDVFSRLAHEAGGLLHHPVSRAACQELFDAMSSYLDEHSEDHRARYGQVLQLRGGAAQGTVLAMEVTSGDRREVIRAGDAVDRAEELERAREAPGLEFDPEFPE